MNIVELIKDAGLVGRGGACFPTADKWRLVKEAPGVTKYVVVNASEGEPGVHKDAYLLEKYPAEVVDGVRIAIETLGATRAYVWLNPHYAKLEAGLRKAVGELPISIVLKPAQAGYIGGEETAALNGLEQLRIEPRLKPPFPTTAGLYGCPTLIGNVETFLDVSRIAKDNYTHTRFYTVDGDCLAPGVYELPETLTINEILAQSGNTPHFDFFVQIGGDGSGEVLASDMLDRPASGCGSVTIYSTQKHDPLELIRRWAQFFAEESCGQCTPCREGTYRVRELLSAPEPNWPLIGEIFRAQRESSFCGLGCVAPVAITSYAQNVLSKLPDNAVKLPQSLRTMICDCFH